MLKRGHEGTYHVTGIRDPGRYVDGFAERRNLRGKDTVEHMALAANRMKGKRLMYKELVA